MGQMVVTGAMAMCTFGAAPGTLSVTSQTICLADSRPAATIQDCQTANITPFGMCSSLANPAVASATAAAMGALTPQPCTLVAAGTWIPTKPTVLINGKPCLTSDCKLTCSYGGVISITSPGQVKATVT
ncbi:MAG: DUF4280 domain-containing protein [Lachnospiraceae bacterium]|nr:DUF4280 domain-containing protein [Lachnospiraceae bacterium]